MNTVALTTKQIDSLASNLIKPAKLVLTVVYQVERISGQITELISEEVLIYLRQFGMVSSAFSIKKSNNQAAFLVVRFKVGLGARIARFAPPFRGKKYSLAALSYETGKMILSSLVQSGELKISFSVSSKEGIQILEEVMQNILIKNRINYSTVELTQNDQGEDPTSSCKFIVKFTNPKGALSKCLKLGKYAHNGVTFTEVAPVLHDNISSSQVQNLVMSSASLDQPSPKYRTGSMVFQDTSMNTSQSQNPASTLIKNLDRTIVTEITIKYRGMIYRARFDQNDNWRPEEEQIKEETTQQIGH